MVYKCTDFYDPKGEVTIRWDDPTVNIHWPIETPMLSEKDRARRYLRDLMDRLPRFGGPES